jgi:hypothetical protein
MIKPPTVHEAGQWRPRVDRLAICSPFAQAKLRKRAERKVAKLQLELPLPPPASPRRPEETIKIPVSPRLRA